MRLQNYSEAVQLLLPKLKDYLESRGINTSKNFSCLNPNHEDKHPSCGIVPSGEAWNCHSCGMSGTIFNACAILEQKPSTGPEFIHETLTYLAEKYEVPLKKEEPTEEELYRIDTYKAYGIAGELVVNGIPTETFEDALKERGWSKETARELGIGFVKDFKEFKDNLRATGFSNKFLAEVDLNRETIFGTNCLIFTIKDEHGSPVGFASRDLNFNDKEEGSKYVNQKGTGVKCNIYQKSKRLFGLSRFLQKRGKRRTPLYLFEGYSDVATAVEHGLWNCSAIGGTALTVEHIHLLKEKNIYDLILCLDGDTPGQEATARLLDTILAGHKDLDVKIVIIPGGMDPDEYIRKESIHKFRRLKKQSAFEWRLNRFDEDADSEEICKKMIPLIINECSYIKQEQMAKELAGVTGFTLKNIQKELDRLQNKREADKIRDVTEIGEKLIQGLKKDPQGIQHLINEADISLYDLSRRYDEDAFSIESMVSRIRSQKEHEETLDELFPGFILGPTMNQLQEALAGNWKKDVWMVIGGKSNVGKTSFVVKLAYEIARHEENNALVIYHTIDDTFEQVLPKFVSLASDAENLELNMIMNPQYAVSDTADGEWISEGREDGYNRIMSLANNARLIVKDANDGMSVTFADHMIRRFKEMYPDRNVIYILDNFHKLEDFQGTKDERVRFKMLSGVVKRIATKYHIPVITTVEYKKLDKGKRAENSDIIETGKIEYDSSLIAHVYNEAHELGPVATTVHRNQKGQRLPVLELDITKNKITDFKDRLYFKFWPAASRFSECTASMVKHFKEEEKKQMGDGNIEHKQLLVKVAKSLPDGHKDVRAAFLMAEELNLNMDIPEENKQVWDIFNKAGGENAVRQARGG